MFYFTQPKLRLYIVLAFSVAFFCFNNSDPKSIWLMLLLLAANYFLSVGINRTKTKLRKTLLILGILGNVSVLIIYKYTGFLGEIIGKELPLSPQIMMVGISFTTFTMISYLVDVYMEKTEVPGNPAKFACYGLLFPKILMGPIVRYNDYDKDLEPHSIGIDDVGNGAKLFMAGFVKKVLIADSLYPLINQVNSIAEPGKNATVISLWLGAIAYSLQLFFDFSGYSDMAIGLARMLGFKFKKNFDHPYACNSFTDFWRRWHISLSEWFRDYIYIPMGGSQCSKGRNIFNLFVVWLLTGIWHGAGYGFIVWGLVFFVMLVIEKYIVRPKNLKRIPAFLWRIFTLLIINFNWVIFSHGKLRDGIEYCLGMVGFYNNVFVARTDVRLLREFGIFLILGILFSIPIEKLITKKIDGKAGITNVMTIALPILYTVAFIWALSYALLGFHNPFLYQQF